VTFCLLVYVDADRPTKALAMLASFVLGGFFAGLARDVVAVIEKARER
jgi:hypothetical protein